MYKSRIFVILLFAGLILPMGVGVSIAIPSSRGSSRADVITNPTDGETVSGTVVITTTNRVDIYIDGTRVARRVTRYSWDTTAYSDGSHSIRAYRRRSGIDETITVYVDNAGGEDTTPPTVSITNPGNGATVSGTISVTASASDNVGVTQVEFYIDGSLKNTDTSSPYSYSWDTTGYIDGSSHTIETIAYDAAENSDSDIITVTVDNSVPPPPGDKYALIAGVSDYKAISDLSYCDEDASDWYNYLIDIGYDSDNIVVLGDGHTNNYPKHDGYATEANLKYYLNWLAGLDAEEICFITSGHGSGNGRGSSYLCAWDCGAGESGEDGDLWDTEIAAILDNVIADKVFVFVDHCYSGGLIPEISDAVGNKLYMTTTCDEDGYGWDDPSSRNGLWTHYFLEYALIDHFNSNPNTAMEDAFDYALAAYPYGGANTPQEQDNYPGDFTL